MEMSRLYSQHHDNVVLWLQHWQWPRLASKAITSVNTCLVFYQWIFSLPSQGKAAEQRGYVMEAHLEKKKKLGKPLF